MTRLIEAVVEYNGGGYLIHAANYVGAYVRGRTLGEATAKFPSEIRQYCKWARNEAIVPDIEFETRIVQQKLSELEICDADTDVIFDTERDGISQSEYVALKSLAIKSARDFQALYDSVPDKDMTFLAPRKTFYGDVPRTASEMYVHTNRVTCYYGREIGVVIDNLTNIAANRENAFRCIEDTPNFLSNMVFDGSHNEQWSLRKVIRRLMWHDRIHARAMYRIAIATWNRAVIENPFFFTS